MASANPDAIIMPPKILGRQTCSECHKYLSVGPVAVTRGGRTICGRCNVNSLYDQVAENCLFPCVNYNAGCLELLPYNEAKDHEANCSKKAIVSCPFCRYKGDECQLVLHFKGEHSEYVVDHIFEPIPKEGCARNLIFLKDEHILCIRIVLKGRFLKIYNTLLSPSFSKFTRFMLSFFKFDDDNHFISFRIQITPTSIDFPVDIGIYYEEEMGNDNYVQLENCFLVAYEFLGNSLRSDSYYCTIDYVDDNKNRTLEMAKQKLKCHIKDEKLETRKICSEENPLKPVNYVLKMNTATLRQLAKQGSIEAPKCSRCTQRIIDSSISSICPKDYLVCQNCVDNKCPECDSFVQWDSHNKCYDILLKCEWDCKNVINIFKYRQHVQVCKARRFKCPDKMCSYIGLLDDIINHWHLNKLERNSSICFRFKITCYWLLPKHQELVFVTFEHILDDQYLVTIHEDYALFPEFYRFELTDTATVLQDWIPLINGIGRCLKVKCKTRYCYINVISC